MELETNEIIHNRAILVGMNHTRKKDEIDIESSMEELAELAQAAGVEVLATTVQNREAVNAALYIGKGKVEEIKQLCDSLEANLIIFNDELSGSQIRNLEEAIQMDVIDRTTLILDIFAQRATTKEAKLQVELAQLKYRLPRLTGLGKKLSRLGAGIGTRGPGETKLETDRRHIERKIDFIKEELREVKKVREVQRSQRLKSELPIVALVGYTNAGKSTLMNVLLRNSEEYEAAREVYAENMLFATLEVSLRKMAYPDNLNFLLTDTVGFVSKLPHNLVDAFKATLEEVTYADLLLHVIDASNENYHLQKETTLSVLKELKVDTKRIIDVYNKIDALEDANAIPKDDNIIGISALNGTNLNELMEIIRREVGISMVEAELIIPYNKGSVASQLHEIATVITSEYQEEGIYFKIKIPAIEYPKYIDYEIE
ncbi:GTPase HflX [Alkaliphilus hydrothermalis]|uniref:GTPase HflX n=1 Tax=Alkaliphilus hydrothermalis TaxID=1482730 RepID=A0ABS2NKW0_9FIRM|nr:GTPase HflX [Alkaliphilus hydrothermalis]MBM7613542.1 GTP-binding protein HflX [Alkaliphilus hydrothermalis]